MKQHSLYLLLIAIFVNCIVHAGTPDQNRHLIPSFKEVPKTVYGFLYYDYAFGKKGFVNFNVSSTNILDMFCPTPKDICAGAFAENTYYAYFTVFDEDYEAYVPSSLSKVDMKTGQITQITALDNSKPILNDMTYDYSTKTMFGIRSSEGKSILVKVDLTNGKMTDVTNIEQNLMTLACSYSGQLYGITFPGNLYKINKTNGTVTLIGETGQELYTKQSMEFDHDTNTLYWLCNNSSNESFLATVDIHSGALTRIGSLGDHAQLTGLYIPFESINEQAPAKIADFKVVSNQQGALSAVLSWTNPSKTHSGTSLNELTSVEIYRNNNPVHRITSPAIGSPVNWTDNITEKGSYIYKIVPFNQSGNGASNSTIVYVGKDLPGAVANLRLTVDNNTAKLSWQTPYKGLNDGWFDTATLKYKIVRLPGNVVIADGFTGNSFEDKSILSHDRYSYKLISINEQGEGGTALSNAEIIGSSIKVPYYCDFESEDKFSLWTIADVNADGYKWRLNTESLTNLNQVGYYSANRNKNADEWLFTPPLHMESGRNYVLKIKIRSFGPNYPEKMAITVGKSTSPENHTRILADYPAIINKEFELKTLKIDVTETGNYHIGFHCYSPIGSSSLYIDDLSIEESGDKDLAAILLKGAVYPVQNKPYDYTLTVKNSGEATQDHFTLRLADENDATLTSKEINERLEPEQTKEYILTWKPSQVGKVSVYGVVMLPGDINNGNDRTPALIAEVRAEGETELIKIGEENRESNLLPVNFSFQSSTSQTIYLQKEIGLKSGLVKKITYPYSFTRDDISGKHIRIYLANTFENSLKEDFIRKDQFTLVFDGNITMPKDKKELEIILSTPYLYSGNNLVVMFERVMDKSGYMPGVFYLSSSGSVAPNRTRYYSDDLKSFDFQPKAGSAVNLIPNLLFSIDTDSGGSISGTMIDDYEDPVPGAIVRITELNAITKADENGRYRFDNIPAGTYKLAMTRTGYYDFEWPGVNVTDKQTTNLYLEMERMGKCTVSGNITTPEGTPLAGAEVRISGYAGFSTVSAQDGSFSIEKVYVNSNYTLTVSSGNLAIHSSSFSTGEDDLDLQVIRMKEIMLPVCGISHSISAEGMKISWSQTTALKNFRRDDGSVGSQLNAGANNPYQLFGTVYRDYTVLYNMSWQTTDNTCKHEKVNVFVFALDKNGEPTTQLLYSKNDVPSTDWKWCTHTFETPVEAPNGFLVALTSDLPMDIAIDSGTDEQYPFEYKTNYSGNYKMNVFAPLEDLGYFENFHMRAEGAIRNNEQPGANRGYEVRRLKSGEEATPEKWTKLTQAPVTELSFTDPQWDGLLPGEYRYAVCSIYNGGETSPFNLSEAVPNKMTAQISVTVKTNTSAGVAKGAIVTLTNKDGQANHKYRMTTDATGKVVFKNIWKGTYTLEAAHPDFEYYQSENNDFTTQNEYGKEVTVKEKIYAPFNLQIKETAVDKQRILTWNESEDIFDNFENHPDFAINSTGNAGWQYIDADGQNPITIGNNEFVSNGKKMAYTIFNPSATEPSLGKDNNAKAFSGSKYLACFSNRYIANNDYLISPKLTFDTGFTFSFMGKSYSDQYTLSEIMIGYSLTGKSANDFIWITSEPVQADAKSWVKYEYDIPARATYVALRCVSVNAFLLMIDDVRIGKSGNNNTSVINEVYLDGKKLGQTASASYAFDALNEGTHTAGVKTIYETGSSETATIEFEVKTSGIENAEIKKNSVSVYPNPVKGDSFTLSYTGSLSGNIFIYTQSGIIAKQIDTANLPADSSTNVDIHDLNPGVYILTVSSGEYHSVVKLTVDK